MDVNGASALISGGASGLGEATTRRLHAAGASVVISDLDAEKGEALASELGDRAQFVEANVMEEDQVQAAVDAAAGADGGLRISVCCAGIGWAQRTTSKQGPHNLEYFSNVVKVNLIGTFNVLRLAATAMSENEPDDRGRARRLRQHRVDRGVRRPDRPDRLRGVEGGHRRPDPARRPRPRRARHPRQHDRARASSTRRSWPRFPRRTARRSAPASRSRRASATPTSSPSSRSRSSRTRC